jgi:AraC-like DNA-binding protein
MEKQQSILQNVFLSRLLRGEITDNEEIKANMSRISIEIEGCNFIVVLGYIETNEINRKTQSYSAGSFAGSSDIRTMKLVLSEAVKKRAQSISFLEVNLDENSVAFIGSTSVFTIDEYKRQCTSFFTKIRESLGSEFFIPVSFAIGRPTDDFSHLYNSFEMALYAHENHLLRGYGAGISIFDTDIKRQGRYDYTLSMEVRLAAFMREGNIDGIRTILDHIFESPNDNDTRNNESLKLLLAAIKNTLFRLNATIFSSDPITYARIDSQIMGIDHFKKDDILTVFESMCFAIWKNRQPSEQELGLKDNVLKYVHDNYRRNDFYLGSLTYHFKLSETYLSLFFKKCTGENFVTYVERLRFQDACEMLKDLSIPIEDIASSVGYSSSHTFRRAFKRRLGISPTEYRNNSADESKR